MNYDVTTYGLTSRRFCCAPGLSGTTTRNSYLPAGGVVIAGLEASEDMARWAGCLRIADDGCAMKDLGVVECIVLMIGRAERARRARTMVGRGEELREGWREVDVYTTVGTNNNTRDLYGSLRCKLRPRDKSLVIITLFLV